MTNSKNDKLKTASVVHDRATLLSVCQRMNSKASSQTVTRKVNSGFHCGTLFSVSKCTSLQLTNCLYKIHLKVKKRKSKQETLEWL